MTTTTRVRSAVEQKQEQERRRAELGRFLADVSRRSAEFEAAQPHVGFNLSASLARDVAPLLKLLDSLNRRIREAAIASSQVDPFNEGAVAAQLAEIRTILIGDNQ